MCVPSGTSRWARGSSRHADHIDDMESIVIAQVVSAGAPTTVFGAWSLVDDPSPPPRT